MDDSSKKLEETIRTLSGQMSRAVRIDQTMAIIVILCILASLLNAIATFVYKA